jgi:hypothetical protein
VSHNLVFYQPESESPPGRERVLEALDRLPHTIRHGEAGDYQCLYHNPATGVEFTLEYLDPTRAEEDEVDHRTFPGTRTVGLLARVDYLRPCFFGLEAVPWIAHVADELGLLIFDAHDGAGGRDGPARPEVPALIGSWDEANERATRMLRRDERIEMAFGEREMLDAWWRYRMALPDLEAHYGDAAALPVPELRRHADGTVTTAVEWTYPEATVLPTDIRTLVITRRRRRLGLLDVRERGAVRAPDFFAAVPTGLEHLDEPHPHRLFTPTDLSDADRAAAGRVRLDPRAGLDPINPTRLTHIAPE